MKYKDIKLTREELLAAYAIGERDFASANLSSADLSSANLSSADLSSANLEGANLKGANLKGANLKGANLKYVYLKYTYLKDTNLTSANLYGAKLAGANLSGANLTGANLTGATLSGANLCGANLCAVLGFRFPNAPDPAELRKQVAEMIESKPELHDQECYGEGDPNGCGTPCCVAGLACRLGGGTRGEFVSSAATRLLWIDGKPMPSFKEDATRKEILAALRA